MAQRRRNKDEGPRPGAVVRRPRDERKGLHPEYEALARGDRDRLPGKKRRPRLKDPRAVALVPGVANRDARAVHDARLERMRKLLEGRGDPAVDAELARAAADAVRLGVWRGRSLTGFDVFAEQMLGIEPADLRDLAERGAAEQGVPYERASDEAIAAWMRAEVALLEAGVEGRVTCEVRGGREHLRIDTAVDDAPQGLDAVGRKMIPLARDRDSRD